MTTIPGYLEDGPDDDTSSCPDKFCPACRRSLWHESFDSNPYANDGYYTYCKDCRAAKKREKQDPTPELDQVEPIAPVPMVPRGTVPAGLLKGIQVPEDVECPMEGVWAWTNAKGWRVVAVHFTADPDKRPGTESGDAWIEKKKKDSSERDWKREYDLDHTIAEGDPFYATFNRSLHQVRCVYDPLRPLLRFWDFGRGHPAIVFAQLDVRAKVRILWSHIYTNLNIYQFAPLVLAETNARFPDAKCHDYGDPAGAQESDKGATTSILLDTFKIKLVYRFSFIEEGTKMIDQKLMMQADGTPGLLIDPCNKDLLNGFESGYVLDTGAGGKDNEGRLKNSPKKDGWYEHCISGQTTVRTLTGWRPIKDLVGEEFVTYAYDGRRIVPALARDVRRTRTRAEVWKLTLDDGQTLIATPDHLIMRRDGSFQQLEALVPGDSLMPFYEKVTKKGYVTIELNDGSSAFEHRYIYGWFNGPLLKKHHVHHKDENRQNNLPSNLEQQLAEDHMQGVYEKVRKDPSRHASRSTNPWTPESRAKVSLWAKAFWKEKREPALCPQCGKGFMKAIGRKHIYCSLDCGRHACEERRPRTARKNHKVVSVEFYGHEDVYNLEVDTHHNFVANGIVVHNCMDALRYGIVNIFTMMPDSGSEKDKAWEKIGLWRTNEQHAERKSGQDPMEEFNL